MLEPLYHQLRVKLGELLPQASKPQIRNQSLLTQSLAMSPNCHLATLATYLPLAGQRENLVQRMRRWLANQTVNQRRHYLPLVRHLFTHWTDAEVGLVMDRTDLGQQASILLLSAAFRHRVLPLAWRLLPFGGTGADVQLALLQQIQPLLPSAEQTRITFYGDSEFRAVAVQRYCQQHHWHWQVGLKSDILFRQATGAWAPLASIPVEQGERRYLHHVWLTQHHNFGPVHLLVDWTQNQQTPRYFVGDQPTDRLTWRRGRKRFWIEPFFRDWKSYGFDLEATHLTDAQRLNSLLVGMATASLWLMHVGQWVIATGRQSLLAAPHKRDYSLFRLGRDYLQRAFVRNHPIPVEFAMP